MRLNISIYFILLLSDIVFLIFLCILLNFIFKPQVVPAYNTCMLSLFYWASKHRLSCLRHNSQLKWHLMGENMEHVISCTAIVLWVKKRVVNFVQKGVKVTSTASDWIWNLYLLAGRKMLLLLVKYFRQQCNWWLKGW